MSSLYILSVVSDLRYTSDKPCRVVLTYGCRYWSQQVSSLSWLRDRELQRVFGKGIPSKLTRPYVNAEFVPSDGGAIAKLEQWRYADLVEKHGPMDSWPTFDNIWDAYKYIGYDKKKRRISED